MRSPLVTRLVIAPIGTCPQPAIPKTWRSVFIVGFGDPGRCSENK
jgi:hypothetical protein